MTSRPRLRLLTAALICLALASPIQASPRSPRSDRQAIVALENLWIDAKDARTLNRVLADDFIHPVFTGDIIDKSQHIDWALKHPRAADRHARFARLEVRLFGDIGQAYGVVALSDHAGREIRRTVFTDVFAYRGGRWQAVSAQETVVDAAGR